MSDIENELRRLGDNLRSGTRGSETLPVRQRRRIKVRRALFAAAGAVTAIALVASASFGLNFVREGSDIAPAEDATSTLIRFDRSGGFTGDHHVLTVKRDGSSLLESPGSRGLVEPMEFELEPDVMASLQDAVANVAWGRVEGHHPGTMPGVGVADGYLYEIEHDDYVVDAESGVEPRSLKPLIGVLNDIIDRRLGDAVPDEPSLALSETEVRAGDIVELAIRAPSEYTWGVASWLEAQRDGGWRRAGYWRTSPDKGPEILEAITARGGTIEAIGFSGSADFKLEIPQLDPGTYRIRKDFVTAPDAGGSLEERTTTAEVRFEVVAGERSTREQDFAAIWPEDDLENAERACQEAAEEDASVEEGGENVISSRADPESIVLEFGFEVLGWSEGEIFRPRLDIPSERSVYGLRRGDDRGASPRDPEVMVSAIEVQPGCWSVQGVSRMPDRRPTGVSIGVDGREVTVGFDTLGAAAGILEVGYGGTTQIKSWVAADAVDRPVRLLLDARPATTGHFLILFEDADGRVFSASGGPLPAGDFAAG